MKNPLSSLFPVLFFIFIFLLAACGGSESEPSASDPTSEPISESAAVDEAPTAEPTVAEASPTDAPPTEAEPAAEESSSEEEAPAADAPVLEAPAPAATDPTATLLVDLNVRTGPGTNYDVVGALSAGSSASIIGKSPNGGWWKIQCPPNSGSECWISAGSQYSTAANADAVQVAAVPPAPAHTEPTAVPTDQPAQEPTGEPVQEPTGEPVQEPTGEPVQEPTSEPVQEPVQEPTGEPVQEPTSEPVQEPTGEPIQEAKVADFDNDSLQNPAQTHLLRITGTRNFSHSNAVSYANGDQDDWVQFEFPNNSNVNQNVWITLNCTIEGSDSAQLRATIWEDGAQTSKIVICGQGEQQLTVDNTKVQSVRIHWGITDDDIYADYTLTVVGFK